MLEIDFKKEITNWLCYITHTTYTIRYLNHVWYNCDEYNDSLTKCMNFLINQGSHKTTFAMVRNVLKASVRGLIQYHNQRKLPFEKLKHHSLVIGNDQQAYKQVTICIDVKQGLNNIHVGCGFVWLWFIKVLRMI